MVVKNPCKCDKKTKRNYYRYYDTPDGCDIEKKIMVTTRYGITTGLIFSAYDVLMHSRATGMRQILKRYMFHTVPLGLMGATFAAVANGALTFRGKDDRLNYFLGGLACGPILAAYLGSGHAVLLGGLALGAIGVLKKDSVENGYATLFVDSPPSMRKVDTWRHDWTMAVDPRDEMIRDCGKTGFIPKEKIHRH